MTTKRYTWNGNNPTINGDPTGFWIDPYSMDPMMQSIVSILNNLSPSFAMIWSEMEQSATEFEVFRGNPTGTDASGKTIQEGGSAGLNSSGSAFDVNIWNGMSLAHQIDDLMHEVGHAYLYLDLGHDWFYGQGAFKNGGGTAAAPTGSGASNMNEYLASWIHDQINTEAQQNGLDNAIMQLASEAIPAEMAQARAFMDPNATSWNIEGYADEISDLGSIPNF
jgi:hypothetical protein